MSSRFGFVSSGNVIVIVSPPLIQVAVDATESLTRIYCFFRLFLRADLVAALLNTPTPYSCSRTGVGSSGTIWVSVVSVLVVRKLVLQISQQFLNCYRYFLLKVKSKRRYSSSTLKNLLCSTSEKARSSCSQCSVCFRCQISLHNLRMLHPCRKQPMV